MEYYAIFDRATGAIQSRSVVPDGTAAQLELTADLGVIVMDYAAFVGVAADDLGPLKTAVIAQVNTGAGDFRKQFITDIPGQQATYLAKETEARAWTSGADATAFPYLSGEASATGSTLDAVAALVLATAEQWRALDPKIEGRRRGATVAIDAATNIAAIVAGASVDWAGLLAPPAVPAPNPVPPGAPTS